MKLTSALGCTPSAARCPSDLVVICYNHSGLRPFTCHGRCRPVASQPGGGGGV